VAVVLALLAQRLAERAGLVDAVLAVVVAEEHRQAHAARQVLAATDSFWSTKSSRYEQSLRHPWWHSPQHHRP
jgi:hypothetical protein